MMAVANTEVIRNTGSVPGKIDQEDSLEEEMATHSSILAWRISPTEELGGATYSPQAGKESDTTEHKHCWLALMIFQFHSFVFSFCLLKAKCSLFLNYPI